MVLVAASSSTRMFSSASTRERGLCTFPLRSSIHGVCRDMLPANAECELSVIVGVVRQLYWEAAHTGSAESLRRVIDG